jgi:hypothetical protein
MNIPKIQDNAYLSKCLYESWEALIPLNEVISEDPRLTSVIVENAVIGVSQLGSTSLYGQPKLNPKLLFSLIACLPVISTKAVTDIIGNRYSKASIKRYTQGARVISKILNRVVTTPVGESVS